MNDHAAASYLADGGNELSRATSQAYHRLDKTPRSKTFPANTMEEGADTKTPFTFDDQGTAGAADVPSRASFLGLPAEMRLRIYHYLLDASRRPDAELDGGVSGASWHCCFKDSTTGSVKCGCRKTFNPNVLRVCKLVHQEAEQVLHASLELRIDTPPLLETAMTFDRIQLLSFLRSSYSHNILANKLALATSLAQIPIRIHSGEDWMDRFKPLWSELGARTPNVTSFRLYLRFNIEMSDIDEAFDYDELLGMLILPELRKLIFDVFIPENPKATTNNTGWGVLEFLHELKRKAEVKIKRMDRVIEVTTTLRKYRILLKTK